MLPVVVAAAVGLVAGVLLPTTAYRLSVALDDPVRGSCGECGHPFGSGLSGWVRVPPRCASCRAWCGPRPWLTAPLTAAACALTAWAVAANVASPLFVGLAAFGVLLGAIDLACKRLPHVLVVPAIGVSAAAFAVLAAATGEWSALLGAGIGAVSLGGCFFLLHLLPGRGPGFGDVTLAVLLGLFLGWLGEREVVLGALLPWLLNGPVVLLLVLSRRVDWRSSLPFGPALLGGGLAAVLVSVWLPVVGRL